ncbi:MAG: hypothetical protein K9N47_19995 [Prosthecobacter sp.]|uniref:hypothetical protein n=1 Tax=Prosthecobacter sp. TaxID=1965333 RepID=UPI0025F7D52D|nr:hypothetical protein [Prosthecobacter sp.]MCF7788413.1 hypothetical protein [Prosthecobacter sp.]
MSRRKQIELVCALLISAGTTAILFAVFSRRDWQLMGLASCGGFVALAILGLVSYLTLPASDRARPAPPLDKSRLVIGAHLKAVIPDVEGWEALESLTRNGRFDKSTHHHVLLGKPQRHDSGSWEVRLEFRDDLLVAYSWSFHSSKSWSLSRASGWVSRRSALMTAG